MEIVMVKLISMLVIFLLAALFVLTAFLMKKKGIKTSYFTKPLSLTLIVAVVLRYLYESPTIYHLRGLSGVSSPFNAEGPDPLTTGLAVFLIWFGYAAMMTTVLGEFFNYKTGTC